MKYHQIALGTKLELELFDEKGEKVTSGLVSQFESYDEDSSLMKIHNPFTQGKIYTINSGTKVKVYFSRENDIYVFEADVIEGKAAEPVPMMLIRPVSPIEKIERRSFFRMDCELPVEYCVIDSEDEINVEKPLIKCYTKDISGGGICMITDVFHEAGTNIKVNLRLDREIVFTGMVVRATQIREKGKIRYETGVIYKHIRNMDREKIISFVFETQRERIRKGWMKI
ncbi:type IV pilus assembly PilZ [Thermoclostridium stercorarium subsp. stercorarium DSM 8532]|jgi:c-di-GMP-binding flagellar brake protein YcgR|uniref:Type IV pilus assembly PilZ n=4 Tax=Thermoclostridium stercorarium TaxID=1510 RepID=L7VM70_THES1|nr:flagellar brake protein [Thermoclostridium stercorarium]AGC67724.1 type IV pilus assembly PilZ [Thermoclostridium stercorarium subsp. stercorarium DSM 8532]AGI38775.1 glycosyltransferase [Thermoclostridium stercorarium subsp. stercorarium DSM 8532]ANW98138.1 pilus assembly protein PilZ [Thermoclostridium stercorarium subsp. thermolacticum DSM 2910]ANX00677.1 pilus assembly protein PilZ [Thermoclostridium stercorarium subsp. leptospartum DSM 9219]UZQ86292.1 flagellar brake protein [Thermoclo